MGFQDQSRGAMTGMVRPEVPDRSQDLSGRPVARPALMPYQGCAFQPRQEHAVVTIESASTTAQQIKSFAERFERLLEEIERLKDDLKDLKAEAKGAGFNVRALEKLVAIRRKDAADREVELLNDLLLYASATGTQLDVAVPEPTA